ncbi:hypothetical protein [Pseudomonas aeruginosa]|uniref:hypothetical protein n=1 Tax=Pseudomonas aeruginosa TaxID=287 RepID=UPI001F503A4E|nr:hypothetical protein [Pseudomonas aeruginosa]
MELPYRLHLGDCLQVLKTFPDNSFDSVVTDPPYGIRFMGKAWDGADIEREPPYLAIAEARIAHELERVTAAALETAEAEAQLDIFRDAKEQIA